jgi:hypothetical protein
MYSATFGDRRGGTVHGHSKRNFWIETALATLSGVFCALTLLWSEWIELLFGIDPDHGNGSAEWLIALTSLAVTVAFAALARREWRRASVA